MAKTKSILDPEFIRERNRKAAFVRNGSMTPEQRFWSKIQKTDGCWPWPGQRNRAGYGEVSVNCKWKKAHRFAWEITNGAIPGGLHVCHRCDNRACVRPDHLFLGTAADNMNDAASKGRVGKLNPEQVRQLRTLSASGVPNAQLGQQFGISLTQVGRAINRRTYKHIK